MTTDKQRVHNAISAVRMLKECESLLASGKFYTQASQIQTIRGDIERCSVTSVENGRPDDGKYSPRTIGQAVEDEE